MKFAFSVILIVSLSYLGFVFFTGCNAYSKYEKIRNEYGRPYINLVNVGRVNMTDWILEFDRLDTRATAGKFRFDQIHYHKDALELLGKSINVEEIIDIYTWEMPKFQFLNNKENIKNAKRLMFRLKNGLIGDKIEKGIDKDGNQVARLSLNGRVTVLWLQDGDVPCEYTIVFKKSSGLTR